MVDGPQARNTSSQDKDWLPAPNQWVPLPPTAPRPALTDRVSAGESNVAARLLAIIGAVVFVAGVVFFLKLAFDRGWIDPLARVALGVGGGLALWGAGLALDLRGRLAAYGQTLSALGAVTAYVTTWLAYQLPTFRGITGLSMEADAILLGILALGLAAHAALRPSQWLAGVALGLVLTTVFVASAWAGFTVGYLVLMVSLLVGAAAARRWTVLQAAAVPVAFGTLLVHLALDVAPFAILVGVAALVPVVTVAGALRPRRPMPALQGATQAIAWLAGWGIALGALASLSPEHALPRGLPGLATGVPALITLALASVRALPAGSRIGWAVAGVALALAWPVLQFDGAAVAFAWAAMALALALAALVTRGRLVTVAAAVLAAWAFGRLVAIDSDALASGDLAWAGGLLLFGTAAAAGLVGWLAGALDGRRDPATWVLLGVACSAPMLFAAVALTGPMVTLAWSGVFLSALAAGILAARPDLRVAGLAALTPVLVRLVFFDLSGVDVVLRVLAYTGVGAAVLVGAYVYARAANTRQAPRVPPPSGPGPVARKPTGPSAKASAPRP